MRPQRAGETNQRSTAQAEWSYKSRTYVGQIESVTPENGVIQVRVGGIHDSKKANIPLWGLHFAGFGSSWCRYMPEAGAFVKVAYGPRNELEVLGYEAYGDDIDPATGARSGSSTPRIGGYSTLRKLMGEAPKLKIFRALKPGEFDLRSAGGAGYYFTRDGVATIEAGPRIFSLDKTRDEARGRAGLHMFGDDGVEVRWGNVKRQVSGADVVIAPSPTGAAAAKEWSVKVGYPTPPLGTPALTFYSEEAGDIRDALGAPVAGVAAPLRYRKRLYNAAGLLSVLSVEVDALGNTKVVQAATAAAGGVDISLGATNPLTVSCKSLVVSTVTSAIISATTDAELKGAASAHVASAGLNAKHPLVYGDLLLTAFNAHVHATAFGPTIGPPVPVLLGPGVDMSLASTVD